MELDHLDKLGAKAFEAYTVRKDLVRTFSKQYPVPTYVVEFLLGRYCASTDPGEIEEGLAIVERQLQNRAVRAGEQELFKKRAREEGSVKIIDLVTARLDTKTDSYLVTLPSLQLSDVRIDENIVRDQTAVNKTISGLLKLLYPDPAVPVPDEELEWAIRLALEVRRRVKEQQKRVGAAEFRNTHFSYVLGEEGPAFSALTPPPPTPSAVRPPWPGTPTLPVPRSCARRDAAGEAARPAV